MAVSSNTLFHFTNNFDKLISILEKDFIPRYSLEEFFIGSKKLYISFPMVCLCDIPLSQINKHLKFYGNYGIGLYKKWGIKQKLNPVLYLEKNSLLSKDIELIFSKISYSGASEKLNIDPNIGRFLMQIKQYTGKFKKNGEVEKNYKFYDEREWRYVPKNVVTLDEVNHNIPRIRNHYNLNVQHNKLKFSPDDIKYIIIRSHKEIDLIIEKLEKFKSKYSDDKVKRVISRIITVDQLQEDF